MNPDIASVIVSIIALSVSAITAIAGIIVSILLSRTEYKKSLICIDVFHDFLSTSSRLLCEVFDADKERENAYDQISDSSSSFRNEIEPLRYERPKLYSKAINCLNELDDALSQPNLKQSKGKAEKALKDLHRLMRNYYRCLI